MGKQNQEFLLPEPELVLMQKGHKTRRPVFFLPILPHTELIHKRMGKIKTCHISGLQTYASPNDLVYAHPTQDLKKGEKEKMSMAQSASVSGLFSAPFKRLTPLIFRWTP